MTRPLRVAELCAGYGGLYESMRQAGWAVRLAWVAETDPDASTVLAAHHPHVPNIGDITAAQFSACPPVDIIAAGYPCQPFSAAGRRRGMDDERWIWPDVARAVRMVRPRWVVLENVPGHLGRGASRVVADLAGLGYVGSWRCVRASDVGAPHRRERLFILAADATGEQVGSGGLPWQGAGYLAADTNGHTLRQQPVTLTGRGGATVVGVACPGDVGLLPTPRATDGAKGGPNQCHSDGSLSLSAVVQPGRFGKYAPAAARWAAITGRPAPDPTESGRNGQPRLSPRFVEWLMGLPAGYVTDHVGRNPALRILGNGVVPQQGAHALRLLAAHLEQMRSQRQEVPS